jgi:ankyrin repeat protein
MIRAIAAIGLLSLGAAAVAAAAAPQRTLVDLVREGKRENVLAAITSPDVDVNVKAPDGSTSLMWAAYNDDLELVRALLKAGARANVTSNFGATALTEAIKLGDVPLFRTLLDAGADIESPNLDNQTALMLAINTNQVEMAKVLIERGANVKAIEKFRDQTALMWAAAANQPEIVDLLLAKGAGTQVNLRAAFDDWERMQTSEPRAQYGSRQTGGLTALLFATRSGCLRCAVSLVEAGADVNKPNPEGITPLINALDNGKFDIAMFLLDKGANPNVWDMHGRTAIYVAVDRKAGVGGGGGGFGGGGPGGPGGGRGAPAGAAPGAIGGPGGPGTPPGGAGGFGGGRPGGPGGTGPGGADGARAPAVTGTEVIKRLLDMGVDVNHELTRKRPYGQGRGRFQDYDIRGGVGPLFIATMNNDHETMQALLAHGAEVDMNNVMQMTPLMIAAGMRGTGRGGGAADQARAIKTIDLLLDAGANINARVLDSHTHTAVIMAYVAGRDQEGRTALFAAAEGGADKVVSHLLARGADATIRDATGKTALDIARAPPPAPAGGAAAAAPAQAAAPAAAAAGTRAATPAAAVGGAPGGARGAGPAGGGRAAVIAALEAAMVKAGASITAEPAK